MTEDRRIEFRFDGELWAVEYRDSDHAYFLGPASESLRGWQYRVPSPSTIAGVGYMNADALMGWAVRESQEGRDWKASREFTAECGTAAHNQLEALARTGEPLDLKDQPERVRGALQAGAKWWLDCRPKFIASELIVASPTHRFAGRFDVLAEIDGKRTIVDLKTSEKESWKEWATHDRDRKAFVQMAGYEAALRESWPDYCPVDQRCVLMVSANGSYHFQPDPAPNESEFVFLSNLTAYRSQSAWKKAAKAAA